MFGCVSDVFQVRDVASGARCEPRPVRPVPGPASRYAPSPTGPCRPTAGGGMPQEGVPHQASASGGGQ